MKTINFKEIFKFPLRMTNSVKVVTNENKVAFDWLVTSEVLQSNIIDILNGHENKLDYSPNIKYIDLIIYFDDIPILKIDNLNYLINTLNLVPEYALFVEDCFGNWIRERLISSIYN